MPLFSPELLPPGSTPPYIEEITSANTTTHNEDDGKPPSSPQWVPMCRHACTYPPDIFIDKMMELIRNPNLNSTWLFRADILYDDGDDGDVPVLASTDSQLPVEPVLSDIRSMSRQRTLVRKLIPRNEKRDNPLEQTCVFYRSEPASPSSTSPTSSTPSAPSSKLVIYTPHVSSADEVPFYHPKVRGVAHLHQWDPTTSTGTVSMHFLPYADHPLEEQKLQRTAYHLLQLVHKLCSAPTYVKRVNHDVVIPQFTFQNRYAMLKAKHARAIVESWAEVTDPQKHVFEDLGIAAFLIELWEEMYPGGAAAFPGFVDIGCGNGLLVYILNQEGYSGWGFDARQRKSWANYQAPNTKTASGSSLEERLLLPSVIPTDAAADLSPDATHDGIFPPGTFIVSNHADELTPWTPILATISQCPFIMIPCCSHSLTGDKWRAPRPRDLSKSRSTFASLVDWVTRIAEDCGWQVETEMLRIPSTRNTCLLGRKRNKDAVDVDVASIIDKYGGVEGYYNNVAKLVKAGPRGH